MKGDAQGSGCSQGRSARSIDAGEAVEPSVQSSERESRATSKRRAEIFWESHFECTGKRLLALLEPVHLYPTRRTSSDAATGNPKPTVERREDKHFARAVTFAKLNAVFTTLVQPEKYDREWQRHEHERNYSLNKNPG